MGEEQIVMWLSTEKVSALLGVHETTVTRRVNAGKYIARRDQSDGRGSYQILMSSLPDEAQAKYWREFMENPRASQEAAKVGRPATPNLPTPSGHPPAQSRGALSHDEYEAIWFEYDRKPASIKSKAETYLAALDEYFALLKAGAKVEHAKAAIAEKTGKSAVTIWRWEKAVEGHPRAHWLPLLAPRHIGRVAEAEMSEAAWDFYLARRLNTSKTNANKVYKDTREEANKQGWIIPSKKTFDRRYNALPHWLKVAGTQGRKALFHTYPAQWRAYSSLGFHEMWESDGRIADLFCRWPDGSIGRPFVVFWRECRTRMVLSLRGYKNPCAELVITSFGQALARAGAIPERALVDNGREYAAKSVTGGQKTRYRFKVQENETYGVMTMIGTKVQWATPYLGQVKPVERLWKWIAENVDMCPEFQGAYCGKNSVSRPDDCDPKKKAIPVDVYGAKLAQAVEEFNRSPHSGEGMDGITPLQLYEELSANTTVRRPTESQLRLFVLVAKSITLDKRDGSISFKMDGFGQVRYWSDSDEYARLSRGRSYQVYYDPESPDRPVLVYDGKRYICEAQPIGLTAFLDREAGAEHARKRGRYVRDKMAILRNIKMASPVALPQTVGPSELSPLPQPGHAVVIDAPVLSPEAPEGPLVELREGEFMDKETGEILKRRPPKPAEPEVMEDEELERIRAERATKNLPDWMKKQAG